MKTTNGADADMVCLQPAAARGLGSENHPAGLDLGAARRDAARSIARTERPHPTTTPGALPLPAA